VPPPLLDDDLRFDSVPEPLQTEAFVPELAVERLIRAILPGLTRIDQRGIDVRREQPFLNRLGNSDQSLR